jgi:uncharacterized protein (DUF427 family)
MPIDREPPRRIEPGPGQESVWDYPRPPVAVPTEARIRIVHAGHVVADTRAAIRVLETSQPPAYYLPPTDIDLSLLQPGTARTTCEWKGVAGYWTLDVPGAPDGPVADAAWSYARPTGGFTTIAGHLAFYAQRVDECWVDDERVVANPGSFYGGWITASVVGPFKGSAGTMHW